MDFFMSKNSIQYNANTIMKWLNCKCKYYFETETVINIEYSQESFTCYNITAKSLNILSREIQPTELIMLNVKNEPENE